MKQTSLARFFAILTLGTVTTALFIFLGAPFLRVLRNVFGAGKYWLSGLLISGALIIASPATAMIGILLISTFVTVGLYQEFEERGYASFWIALLSVFAGSALTILIPYVWMHSLGIDLMENIAANMQQLMQQLSNGKNLSDLGINPEAVLNQLPAMVILLHVMSLAFALMLDQKTALLTGVRFEKVALQIKLLDFRLPDFLIWVTMLSFLLSFLELNQPLISVVSLNVFNVMMGLYFFQGLAVLEVSFFVFKIGSLMRLLIYLLVVGQLFFLLSAVGVIDYWVDFRQRLKKWKKSERKPRNGENI